jgi:hypothetical protein
MIDEPPGIIIPPAFWRALPLTDFRKFCDAGGVLNRKQCRLLWVMLGRTDKPPRSMTILFNREEVMRAFPAKPEMH